MVLQNDFSSFNLTSGNSMIGKQHEKGPELPALGHSKVPILENFALVCVFR